MVFSTGKVQNSVWGWKSLLLTLTVGYITFTTIKQNILTSNDYAENVLTKTFNPPSVTRKTQRLDTENGLVRCKVLNVVVPSSSHCKGTRSSLGDEDYISNAEMLIKALQVYLSVGKSPLTNMHLVPSLVDKKK